MAMQEDEETTYLCSGHKTWPPHAPLLQPSRSLKKPGSAAADSHDDDDDRTQARARGGGCDDRLRSVKATAATAAAAARGLTVVSSEYDGLSLKEMLVLQPEGSRVSVECCDDVTLALTICPPGPSFKTWFLAAVAFVMLLYDVLLLAYCWRYPLNPIAPLTLGPLLLVVAASHAAMAVHTSQHRERLRFDRSRFRYSICRSSPVWSQRFEGETAKISLLRIDRPFFGQVAGHQRFVSWCAIEEGVRSQTFAHDITFVEQHWLMCLVGKFIGLPVFGKPDHTEPKAVIGPTV